MYTTSNKRKGKNRERFYNEITYYFVLNKKNKNIFLKKTGYAGRI